MCTGKALLNSGVEIRLFTDLVSNYIVTMPAHTSHGFHTQTTSAGQCQGFQDQPGIMDMLSGVLDMITSCLCDVFDVSRNIQRNSVKAF